MKSQSLRGGGGNLLAATTSEALRAAHAPRPILSIETLLNGILGGSSVQLVLPIVNSEGIPKIERGTFRAGAAYFH